jgi:hypothetical protein
MTSIKVLVGSPTAAPYAYCLPAYATAIKTLTYPNQKGVLVDNSEAEDYTKTIETAGLTAIHYPKFIKDSRERLAASRNILRDLTLKEDYDYFLSLEQDVIPPTDIIERLLAHKKDVATGVYCKPFTLSYTHKGKVVKQVKKLMPLLCGPIPGTKEKMHLFSTKEVAEPKVIPVRYAGLGCMLIHRKVLEKIKFRIDTAIPCHDDVFFSHDIATNNFSMVCDTSIKCKHMIQEKPKDLFADCKKGFNPQLLQKR